MSETTIITRFPPEPNGFLHLGHLKAMVFDFLHNADPETGEPNKCILRMDDTNPHSETQEYVDGIIEDVAWLGFKPWKITYTSDYFDILFNYAIQLIKAGRAYVDYTPKDEMRRQRNAGEVSEFRDKPTEWHVAEFAKMATGAVANAVLRLKIDIAHVNGAMRDPVAYRVMVDKPHYRTGTKWSVYPTYDYSHGIVDALEGITYSYCTMEFFTRRDQYLWSVDALGLTAATVVEFGRLAIAGNELSKRKIQKWVADGVVCGYDDPRLLTIRGLRRRGFTPDVLMDIIKATSMSRVDATLEPYMLDHHLRKMLDTVAYRAFAVLNPIPVTIAQTTTSGHNATPIIHANHPKNKDMGDHTTYLTSTIMIDACDFRLEDSPDYYRMAPTGPIGSNSSSCEDKETRPGKAVRLAAVGLYIAHTGHVVMDGVVTAISAEFVTPEKPKKVKGMLHWVSDPTAFDVATGKTYTVPARFEHYANRVVDVDGRLLPDTLKTFDGYVESYVLENTTNKIYQFERIGYYKFDRFDTSDNTKPVFIRIAELKDVHTSGP